MTRSLDRLLRPKSIALFGGGWAANVAAQLRKTGFAGDIWPVHPKRTDLHGIPCLASIDDLPAPPDASFVGVNREATIDVVARLNAMGAGGATCFASGFLESDLEGGGGADLQARLVEAADDMPIIGPNCYGLLNYLDTIALWPDQHGGRSVARGVAIVAQSSNIAINMTMQARGLPIAYVVAAGNQAQTGISDIAAALVEDERVSAIGLYLESFGDIRALEALASRASEAGKPVVVLKIGRSEKARAGTLTHTASLAGSAAAASALIARLGFLEVRSIGVFLETLKLMHAGGPLKGNAICSISCSGGEATLMADMAEGSDIAWRDFSAPCRTALKTELGPLVTIANPLDYHTFIWGDTAHMTRVFAGVLRDEFDLAVFVLDLPRPDRCDPAGYQCAVDAIIAAKQETGAHVAVLTSLPENLTEQQSDAYLHAGVVPLHGMEEGLAAIDAAIAAGTPARAGQPVLLSPRKTGSAHTLTEAEAKTELASFGLPVPRSVHADTPDAIAKAAAELTFPVVLKGLGIAHKSEAGAVALNLSDSRSVQDAAIAMQSVATGYLAEEMATGAAADILVGVTRDETSLMMLTLGAGGIMTELLADTVSILLPATRDDILQALHSLKISALLAGYRGKPAADMDALLDAIAAICAYADKHHDRLFELDVNPLLALPEGAVAVDALIRLQMEED